MSIESKFWVIIPAAGVGSRFGRSAIKQYQRVNHDTLLSLTLNTFLSYEKTHGVVVAINENDNEWASLPQSKHIKVTSVEGGDTRMHSVFNALLSIQNEAAENDWLCVHDAARPGLTLDALKDMVGEISNHAVGGVMGLPVVDTLKKLSSTGDILETVDRASLWRAQTPQMFRYSILRRALENVITQGLLVTDESSAVEILGHKPKMVLGTERNAKITVPEDLELFRCRLNREVSS